MTERQIEILTASIRLAAKNGVHALTIKNISSEIGVTEAALYRHFQSKRDIMLGIIELFDKSTEKDFESLSYFNASPLAEIKNIIIKRIEQFEKFPEIAYIMLCFDIFMHDDELRIAAVGTIHKHKEAITSLILKGQNSGEIRKNSEPKELFRIVLGSFRLLLTQWFLNNYSFDLKSEFESLWKTIQLLIKA
ncbi:MAG: helix-turn-helix domain-containing protein [Lentisphaerota bacterium]